MRERVVDLYGRQRHERVYTLLTAPLDSREFAEAARCATPDEVADVRTLIDLEVALLRELRAIAHLRMAHLLAQEDEEE